jgi:hypothetical protein
MGARLETWGSIMGQLKGMREAVASLEAAVCAARTEPTRAELVAAEHDRLRQWRVDYGMRHIRGLVPGGRK